MPGLKEQIDRAIAAHTTWKTRLAGAIAAGASEVEVDKVRADDVCEFGIWLHQDCDAATRANAHYAKVVGLHAEFHREAARVLSQALAGQRREAQELLNGKYSARSRDLMLALMAWK